jgi:PAS domain S-box-containing protein
MNVIFEKKDQKMLEQELESLQNKLKQVEAERDNLLNNEIEYKKAIINLEHLESIVANMPGYIFWKNINSEYMGCNNNLAKIFGLKDRHEIIGKKDYDFEWGKENAEQFIKNDLIIMQTEITQITEYQLPIRNSNNEFITIRIDKIPLYDNKKEVIGVFGVAFDITDKVILEKKLKIAQEKAEKSGKEIIYNLEYIIANMPGYIYWKNSNSEYMGCNNNLAKISGLNDRSEILGKTDFDFPWGKEEADKFRQDDQLVMQNKVTLTTEYQLPIRNAVGDFIYVRTDKMPLYNEKHNIIGVLAIAVDITEQKILEKNLIAAKEKAELLSQAKTEFIRNMEHDIRTPFGGIYTIAAMLEEMETDSSKKKYLHAISACANELLTYCNNIVDFSRIESGTLPFTEIKFNLKKLIEGIIILEKPPANVKKLKLLMEYPSDIPNIFVGDQFRIQRILINLASNSVKFTNQGYVKIAVKAAKININNIIIKIIIEDTGIGITKEKQLYIYEKFNRLTSSAKSSYKGSGLGLPIVKQFIAEVDGEIDVHSELNKGTIFICTIPLKIPLIDEIPFEDEAYE